MSEEQRVVVLTGAAGDIGRVVARRLAAQGLAVLLNDVFLAERPAVCDLLSEIAAAGGAARYAQADVGRWPEVAALAATALEWRGRVDVWINNAAVHTRGPLVDITPAEWQRTLDVNLSGPFYAMKAILPHMVAAGRGVILNIASVHALLAYPGFGAYDASKGGLLSLSRQAAAEYGPAGVRVNCILPGAIAERADGSLPRWAQDVLPLYPVGRVGRADDVADLIAFLLSDAARFINGAALVLDGGMSARSPEWPHMVD